MTRVCPLERFRHRLVEILDCSFLSYTVSAIIADMLRTLRSRNMGSALCLALLLVGHIGGALLRGFPLGDEAR
jgi:hypothetical protein